MAKFVERSPAQGLARGEILPQTAREAPRPVREQVALKVLEFSVGTNVWVRSNHLPTTDWHDESYTWQYSQKNDGQPPEKVQNRPNPPVHEWRTVKNWPVGMVVEVTPTSIT